jgi:triphosphoribosyl-dephospho-CoA synthase
VSGVRAARNVAADVEPLRDAGTAARRIGRAAVVALYDELALSAKPGLVSFADSGSHDDMDAGHFLRSLFALRHYFVRIAAAGAQQAPWPTLEALGRDAEARMLQATGGVNTHRGAIFTLGLLCAALGALAARGEQRPGAECVRSELLRRWGGALAQRAGSHAPTSHGARAAAAFGLRGAGDEAALGFPVLFDVAVPALRQARSIGLDAARARLQALFSVIAVLADTNLAHRGGMEGLRYAQTTARAFLDAGGAARPDAWQYAASVHRDFVTRRLSPGGAADLLAAALLVERGSAAP